MLLTPLSKLTAFLLCLYPYKPHDTVSLPEKVIGVWFTIPAVFRNLYFRLETAFASEIAQVDASQWAATRLSKAYTAPLYVYFLLIIKAPLLNFGTTSLQSTDYFCCNARFGDASCRYFVSKIPMNFDTFPVDSSWFLDGSSLLLLSIAP